MKASGKPQVVTLWTAPDRKFLKAVDENRVLTIRQASASKKSDVGQIGFHEGPHSSYLIFPEPLPENKEAQVIGVKYDLLEEAAVRDPIKSESRKKSPSKVISGLTHLQKFSVTIRRTATLEKQIHVAAKNKKTAEEEAFRQIEREPFELSEAVLKNEIRNVD